METFLIVAAATGFILSGALSYFLERGARSVAVSAMAPIALLVTYVLSTRDEFGYWALTLTFGSIVCLMGSALGIIASARLKNR